LSNSFQQVYNQQKFKKRVIERFKERRKMNELTEKELANTDKRKNSILGEKKKSNLNKLEKRNSIMFA